MNEQMRKRIVMFYFAGVINLVLGLYILVKGAGFLEPSKVTMLSLFFFGFAAVDFYFPQAIKKKWRAQQQKALQGQGGGNPQS